MRAGAGVQLRYQTGLTGEHYVSRQAWREASLACCPVHPRGGCGFARHGSYPRVRPAGARVARWYCPTAHQTFSLLPDCLAARLSGTLAELEAVVLTVERARSLEGALAVLRTDIEWPGALRWVRRRVQRVHAALSALRGVLPEPLGGCAPRIEALQVHLQAAPVLPLLRALAASVLHELPAPFGLRPWRERGGEPPRRRQHDAGPDPPAAVG